MGANRPSVNSFTNSLDCDRLGLGSIFYNSGQRISVLRNRVEFREHNFASLLADNFYVKGIQNSNAYCVPVSSFSNLALLSVCLDLYVRAVAIRAAEHGTGRARPYLKNGATPPLPCSTLSSPAPCP